MRFSTMVAGAFAGSLACVGAASAQLVVGADQTSNNASIWLIDVNSPASPTSLLGPSNAAIAWGMAANDPGQTLFWNNGGNLFQSSYSDPLSPSLIGGMTFGGSSANVTGMAFHNPTNTLYGYRSVTLPGFYAIDQSTAVMTLVAATPTGTDFGGFDYDPTTNAFYGLNDGTGLQGRGLYRIDNLTSGMPTYTLLTAYPAGDVDIDGLAIGGGRAYMVNDNSTANQGIYVFNLTTLSYEATIPNPFSNTSAIFSAGAWAPGLIPEPTTMALLPLAAGLLLRRRR